MVSPVPCHVVHRLAGTLQIPGSRSTVAFIQGFVRLYKLRETQQGYHAFARVVAVHDKAVALHCHGTSRGWRLLPEPFHLYLGIALGRIDLGFHIVHGEAFQLPVQMADSLVCVSGFDGERAVFIERREHLCLVVHAQGGSPNGERGVAVQIQEGFRSRCAIVG